MFGITIFCLEPVGAELLQVEPELKYFNWSWKKIYPELEWRKNGSALLHCKTAHNSCLMYPISHLLSPVSCLTTPVSHQLSHIICLTSPVSNLLLHVSCHLCHFSCLTSHVSCLMSPVSHSCLTSPVHVSCLTCTAL